VQVSERTLTVRDIVTGQESGELLEVFGSGTACVVQPVGCVVMSDGRELGLPAGDTTAAAAAAGGSGGVSGGWGPEGAPSVAEWARQRLLDIQYGRVPGHPWSVPFE
jgi:branched-chain amino acid aminotransferase